MLAKVVAENHRDWDECLPHVLAAYRASVHESTGFTPNYIVFGKETRAPADLVLPNPSDVELPADNECAYVDGIRTRIQRAHQLVREHLGQAAERRKNLYDSRVKSTRFKQEEWVWYYYPRR